MLYEFSETDSKSLAQICATFAEIQIFSVGLFFFIGEPCIIGICLKYFNFGVKL